MTTELDLTLGKKTEAPKRTLPAFTPKSVPTDLESDTSMVYLPDPVGHHMLIALPTIEQKTKSGLYIPEAVTERERAATVVGYVIAMGPDCYKDTKRFPNGPWCKEGDTVLFSRYQGMRFKSKDLDSTEMVEYRIMTDDAIVGVVPKGAVVGAL